MASMTFLQIVQRAYQESGLQNTGPTAVLAQTGRNADFVRWVLTAHEQIQNQRSNWGWDWRSGSFPLTVGKDSYDPVADFGITGGVREFVPTLGASYVYPTAAGVNSRQFLDFVDWPEFRSLPIPVIPGSPTAFSIDPSGQVRYFPRPNVATTALHEYYLEQEVMAADATVPRMPAKLHMAIVWKAVMLYADYNKDWSLFKSAEEKYGALMDNAVSESLPNIRIAGPLA